MYIIPLGKTIKIYTYVIMILEDQLARPEFPEEKCKMKIDKGYHKSKIWTVSRDVFCMFNWIFLEAIYVFCSNQGNTSIMEYIIIPSTYTYYDRDVLNSFSEQS